ncbi:MAG: hypothetical protein GY940_05405, partial [bacterium]|nr:hypothetical protein [bacterium]
MKLKKIKIPPYLTDDSYKYLKLLIILAVLFLYKAFVFNADAVMTGLVNDVLVFLLMAFFLVKGHLWILPKIKEPIRLMRTVLGLNFLILILFLLNRGMDWEIVKNESHPYVKNLFLISISLVVVSIIMSILAICRELAFLKQKRSPKRTISLMLIFFSLLFFIHGFTTDRTILILAYVLAGTGIFFNSFKVAWIAFLTRKEKVRLLIGLLLLSIFISGNISYSWGTHSLNQLLREFAPGLFAIFRIILLYAGMYSAVVFYTTL